MFCIAKNSQSFTCMQSSFWVLRLPLGLNTCWHVDFISLSSFVYLAAIIPQLMTLILVCSFWLLISACDSFAVGRNVLMKRHSEICTFYTLTCCHYNISCCDFLPSHILYLSMIFALSAECNQKLLITSHQTSTGADHLLVQHEYAKEEQKETSTLAHVTGQRLWKNHQNLKR